MKKFNTESTKISFSDFSDIISYFLPSSLHTFGFFNHAACSLHGVLRILDKEFPCYLTFYFKDKFVCTVCFDFHCNFDGSDKLYIIRNVSFSLRPNIL